MVQLSQHPTTNKNIRLGNFLHAFAYYYMLDAQNLHQHLSRRAYKRMDSGTLQYKSTDYLSVSAQTKGVKHGNMRKTCE